MACRIACALFVVPSCSNEVEGLIHADNCWKVCFAAEGKDSDLLFSIGRNIVSTVNMDCRLELKTIALHARNAEYNPKAYIFLSDLALWFSRMFCFAVILKSFILGFFCSFLFPCFLSIAFPFSDLCFPSYSYLLLLYILHNWHMLFGLDSVLQLWSWG